MFCLFLRFILQRLGVILLPKDTDSERDAEMDSLYSPVMTSVSPHRECAILLESFQRNKP